MTANIDRAAETITPTIRTGYAPHQFEETSDV